MAPRLIRTFLLNKSGESERARQERSRHEKEYQDALKLVWISGTKSADSGTMLSAKREEWGIPHERAAELEEEVTTLTELVVRQG